MYYNQVNKIQKSIRKISILKFILLFIFLGMLNLQAQSMVNPNFEDPQITPGVADASMTPQSQVPGWSTTASDGLIEIWSDGYSNVASFNGTQHIELNANEASVLYQDISGIAAGTPIGYEFAHRGRFGVDVIRLTITDYGDDNTYGTGDDVTLYQHDYNTDKTNWVFYSSSTDGVTLTALGNTIRFEYQAVSTSTGEPSIGNFIDAANFGVGVGGGDGSLPVSLSSFSAMATTNRVTLKWVTESEVENVGFEILRAHEKEGNYREISSYQNNSTLKGQYNTSQRTSYQFVDQMVIQGQTYWYKLVDVDIHGVRTEHGPVAVTLSTNQDIITTSKSPNKYFLGKNFPNPFNPTTSIEFGLPSAKDGSLISVRLAVFDALGKLVKELVNQPLSAGTYQYQWDGRDALGNQMPSGIYIYQLITPEYQQSEKMLLVK